MTVPKTLRWLIRNHGISLTLYAIVVITLWVHAFITRDAILTKADEVRMLRVEQDRAIEIFTKAEATMRRASSIYRAETLQSVANYKLIKASKESIEGLLKNNQETLNLILAKLEAEP
jgi:hypothetical protein